MFAAATRSISAAVVLFVQSISVYLQNSLFKGFALRRLQNKLARVSLKAVGTQAVSLTLMFSVLTTTTPAAATAPSVLIATLNEIGQNVRYAYLLNSGGIGLPGADVLFSEIGTSLGAAVSDPAGVMTSLALALVFKIDGFIGGSGSKNELRAARPAVARIEITPGQTVIREGEQIAFTAIAYDNRNRPVQGAGFNWQAAGGSAPNTLPKPLTNGVFDPDSPGMFVVTATIAGDGGGYATASVQIIVVEDAALKAAREIDAQRRAGLNEATKSKTLRSEVIALMKQPQRAPIDNSIRMDKAQLEELDRWDRQDKQLQKAQQPAPPLPSPQPNGSGQVRQSNKSDNVASVAAAEQSKSVAVHSTGGSSKGGPRAETEESPAEAHLLTVNGEVYPINTTTHVASGWAVDYTAGYYNTVSVNFYIDNVYVGYTYAYLSGCPPQGGAGSCSFSYTIPDRYADGVTHSFYAVANNTYLNTQSFTFAPPPTPNWNNGNWTTATDPGKTPGTPPNIGTQGAGSANFGFSAPAVSLGGRGLDVNLSLNYNSLLWHQSNGQIIYDIDKDWPAPGWSLGFGKLMDMDSQGGSMIEDPNGTRHSYRGTIQPGSPGYSTYYGQTMDGSFIDFISNRTPSGISSGTAYLPNGTVITYGAASNGVAYPTQIKDRNGNYMTIAYQSNLGPNISNITDTEGRVVTFNYDLSNLLTSISGPGFNNTTQTFVRLHYKQLTLSYAFNGLTPLVRNTAPYVIDAVYYPTKNTGYWFGDNDSYSSFGMLAKVIEQRAMGWTAGAGTNDQGTMTAGTMTRQIFYNYPPSAVSTLIAAPKYTSMTESWANMDTAAATTTYDVFTNATYRETDVTLPNGNLVKQLSYNNPGVWNDGLLAETDLLSPSLAVLSKSVNTWALGAYNAPRLTQVDSTDQLNQTTKKTFEYDTVYNQVTAAYDYGYSNNLLRKAVTTYENGAAYVGTYTTPAGGSPYWSSGRHIFSLVNTEELFDGAPPATRLNRTEYTHDGGAPLADTPGVVMYDQSYNPLSTSPAYDTTTAKRGNTTNTIVYADAAGLSGAIPYDSTFDITGNARTIITNCCQQMSFNYTTSTQYSQPESHTKGSSVSTSPDRMTESAAYDFNTGVMTASTDFNNRTTTYSYDAITRPTQTTLATGGKQVTTYDDNGMSIQSQIIDASNLAQSTDLTYYNGRGEVRASSYFSRVTANFADAANFNQTDFQYDQMGRKSQVSVPHPASAAPALWTTYTYDALSRVSQLTEPDGSTSKTFYNEASRPDSASALPGQTVRSQDAWGRERWARTDDFGRAAEVVEPNPAGGGGIFEAGSLQTGYAYDAKDELTQVTQGVQQRFFAYDSLGRLTRQKLAEQTATITDAGQFVNAGGAGARWSDTFSYDARSNLVRRVDARGVVTNYNYQVNAAPDPLNRLQGVSYDKTGADISKPISDAAAVSLVYMTTGDLTRARQVVTAGKTTEENAYDIEGRVSEYRMFFSASSANVFVTSYAYDTINRLAQVTYPAQFGITGSPRKVVSQTYDETSRLKELRVDNQIQMSEIVYNPLSQVTQLKTGAATGNADLETYAYDNPTGLLTNQTVVKATTNLSLLNLSYEYNRGTSNGSLNGKTGQLTHIVNNLDRNKDRVYEFDAVSRLRTAKGGAATGVTGVVANWTQNYSYDRYGNRQTVTPAGITQNNAAVPADGIAALSYDTPSNRINTPGYEYDLAGNLTRGQDASGAWQRFDYDATGRLVTTKSDAGAAITGNGYGAGRERLFSTDEARAEYTTYVWGGDSVLAEYTLPFANLAVFTWKKSYIFAGSRLLSTSTNNGVGGEIQEFHHPDRLGTKLVTNPLANTSFEQATLPFGTSLDAESSGATNQRFTSYDRSPLTGVDYAVNRSYSSAQSRFTSVDPIGMGAASIGNPQSNNLYAYVQNNPIDFSDPSGLDGEPEEYKGPPIIVDTRFTYGPSWEALFSLYLGGRERGLIMPETYGDRGSGGGLEGGGGGAGESSGGDDPKEERCKGIIAKATRLVSLFLKEWNKYNPDSDAIGGFPTKGGGLTKPFGHWQEMKDLQNGMRNQAEQYDRNCNDRNDGRGGRGGAFPQEARSLSNQFIPRKQGPSIFRNMGMSPEAAAKASAAAAAAAVVVYVIWVLVTKIPIPIVP